MPRTSLFPLLLSLCGLVTAWPPPSPPSSGGWPSGPSTSSWDLKDFDTLVVFGDSYSDDSRLNYFATHAGQAPPVGWVDPPNPNSASGGYPWPEFVRRSANVSLYNYAVSGAVCSNAVTPRFLASIDEDFPAVAEYEVPAFLADAAYVEADGTRFFDGTPETTVYAIWIGTNDLGVNAFLTDSQVMGKTIEDYLDCVYDELAKVYANGGRSFVVMNAAPLNLAPLYGVPGKGGLGDNLYWMDKEATVNSTEVSGRMLETVATVNAIYEYRTPVEVLVKKRFPGAQFAVYNVHGLLTDIYNNPSEYLNGTAPLNVTGYINQCNTAGGDCVRNPSPDSFLWFDPLHPSQQTDRVIAREFVDVVKGEGKWATYWG